MDFHVITPAGTYLVMQTVDGAVVNVAPAPTSSTSASKTSSS